MPKRGHIVSYEQNQALWTHVWAKTARKRPKRGPQDKNWAEQEIIPETQNTPRLAQNTPFVYLGAPRACQCVVLSVHMAKIRHPGRVCLGETRPENGQTATEFGLARQSFN